MRILVVDDKAIVRKLCTAILRAAGHKVDEAADGREALVMYEAQRYDATLLDLRMPVMDGVAVLRELQRVDPRAFVVIITAGTDAEIREAIDLGARTIVLKPFGREQILGSLNRVIAHRHASGDAGLALRVYSWTGNVNLDLYAKTG